MRSQSITQIILVVVSVIIIFTYIRPTYGNLQMTQQEVSEYRDALENADAFNSELQSLVTRANSFTTTEINDLERYLPTEVDAISVMRDINLIAERNFLELTGLSANDLVEGAQAGASGQGQDAGVQLPIDTVSFEVALSGSYENFKLLLQDFERNAYPLTVADMSVTPNAETGLYEFGLTLETYQLQEREI